MKKLILQVTAIAIGAVFAYAGIVKALDPAQFALDIQNYRLTAWPVAVLMALYLPWLEIFCGVAMMLRRAYKGALCICTLLTFVFIAALVSANLRGLDISCGCFGHEPSHGLAVPLLRDLAMLAALAILLFAEYKRELMT